MPRQLASVVLLVTLIALAPATRGDDTPKPAVKDESLRQELLRRVKEDQDARKALIERMARAESKDGRPSFPDPGIHQLETIDRRNTAWLKEVVAKHGWPGQSLVGADGANAAWLLVQHADQDRPFQKRCLELLKAAVKKGEATGQQLAYLTDRVRIGEGQKQLYGTQFRRVGDTLEPQPIEDEANVDRRRAEIGLPTLAEYRKQLEKTYKVTPPKKSGGSGGK